MPTNDELIQSVHRFWIYIGSCVDLPMNAPVCRPVWETVMYGCFAIGALIIFWLVWYLVSYRMKLAAALRAQAEREKVADAETMRKHTWAEVADATDVTDPHLAEKIKRELEQRRIQNIAGR